MSIVGWIVLRLIAGFIASKIVKGAGSGFFLNHGARHCRRYGRRLAFRADRRDRSTGFNLWSMFVAVIGAVVVLVAYHLIRKMVD